MVCGTWAPPVALGRRMVCLGQRLSTKLILFPWGYLAVSGDTFDCYAWDN